MPKDCRIQSTRIVVNTVEVGVQVYKSQKCDILVVSSGVDILTRPAIVPSPWNDDVLRRMKMWQQLDR